MTLPPICDRCKRAGRVRPGCSQRCVVPEMTAEQLDEALRAARRGVAGLPVGDSTAIEVAVDLRGVEEWSGESWRVAEDRRELFADRINADEAKRARKREQDLLDQLFVERGRQMGAEKPVVYFAHSMQIYGTQEAEQASLAISALLPGYKMLDPERIDWKVQEKIHGYAKVAESAILQSSRVVVYEYMGHIGRGVADEIERARRLKRPVHVLRKLTGGWELRPLIEWTRVLGGTWKVTYGKVRC